ncbi:hypothetical protein [Niabella sp.]|uniref:hypothetical protein n=1 Tax=Niabella sp. TaxID=1962976 RepID=UPI002639432F|nr:hypothetical protein [Niabella sp.]
MAVKSIKIDGGNIYEWLCSIGYLLPRTDLELDRFEKLNPPGSISVDENAIDPFAIINGTRQRMELSISQVELKSDEQAELRMAARKNSDLPADVLEQIRKNQEIKRNSENDDKKG